MCDISIRCWQYSMHTQWSLPVAKTHYLPIRPAQGRVSVVSMPHVVRILWATHYAEFVIVTVHSIAISVTLQLLEMVGRVRYKGCQG